MTKSENTTKKNAGGRPVGLRKLPDGTYAMPESDGITYISKKDGTKYRFEPKVKRHPGRQKGLHRRPDGTWGYDTPEQDPKKKVSVISELPSRKSSLNIAEMIVNKKQLKAVKDNFSEEDSDEAEEAMTEYEDIDSELLMFRIYPIVQHDFKGMWGYTPKQVFEMFGTDKWMIVAPEAILVDGNDIYSPFFDALEMTEWWKIKKNPIRSQNLRSYWLVMDDRNDTPVFIFTEVDDFEKSFNILNNNIPTGDSVYTESSLVAFVPVGGYYKFLSINASELHGRKPQVFTASGLFRGNIKNTEENKDMYKGLVSLLEEDENSMPIASILSISEEPNIVKEDKVEAKDDIEEDDDTEDESDEEDEFEQKDSYYDYYGEMDIGHNHSKSFRRNAEKSTGQSGYMPNDWEIGYTKKRGSASYSVASDTFMQDMGDGTRRSKTFSLSDDIDYNNDMD